MSATPPFNNDLPYPNASSTNIPKQQRTSNSLNQFEIGDEESSFQPIDMGHVGTGAMDNAAYPPAQPPQQQQQQNNAPTGWFQRLTSCFSVGSLQTHFDVDTEDVKDRVIGSVRYANSPDYFMQDILKKEGKSADLYGPVWITMTCVFLFAVTSNTAKYLHTDSLTDFEYDISHLVNALHIFGFYTFVFPLILFLVFKAINVPLTLVELISLYGYSLIPYLPATILCLFPVVILEYAFLLLASGLSLLLIVRNIAGPIVRTSMSWSGPIIIGIMGCHFIFFFVLKWTFYKHRYHAEKGADNGFDNMDDGMEEEEIDDDGGVGRW